jgi:hypothetical protein
MDTDCCYSGENNNYKRLKRERINSGQIIIKSNDDT